MMIVMMMMMMIMIVDDDEKTIKLSSKMSYFSLHLFPNTSGQ